MEALKEYLATSTNPIHFTRQDLIPTRTCMDHFPYQQYYRGKAFSNDSIVFDRKAGWNPICPKPQKDCSVPPSPVYCWEVPCNTVLPCEPRKPAVQFTPELVRQVSETPVMYR